MENRFKIKGIIKYICLAVICLSYTTIASQSYSDFYFQAAGSPMNPKVQVSWNRYYTNAGLEKIYNDIVKAYPKLAKLESAGKSFGGRDIWVLTISDFSKGDPGRKPAMWVDGNIHGNEIQGTEMALYIAWYLTEMFQSNPFIQELLEQKTFYITPTVNPDGRAFFTEGPGALRSGIFPLDNDRDGIADEDDAQDLNGDGFITQMRKKNPNGQYIPDPNYPNRLIPAPQGVQGQYDLLGNEGIDLDGDGRVNEDGVGGYDPNRDYGFNWQPNYIQGGALKYPFCLPESQAVRDFILKHNNIAGVQCFHNNGGMLLTPPGAEGDLDKLNRSDRAVYDHIGRKGEELIPDYNYYILYKDLYTVYGGALDWTAFGRGIFTFSNELWASAMMYRGKYKGDPAAIQYEFSKSLLFNDSFVEWSEFDHPQYGKIEIGGFKKNSPARLHPGFLLEGDAHRNAAFVIYHAYNTPHLTISNVTEKAVEGGYKEITAEITNHRVMPTHSSYDIQNKIERPDWVSISGPQVLAGMVMQNVYNNQGTEQKVNPSKLAVTTIPGNSTVAVRWIVKGNQKYTITVDSAKGGLVSN
ncbi:MAG: hypothetical protein LBE79_11735 [Tannerella sp.]|jgi:hypothetical protein|nr:hypothetical protein [Tannerella sp.]